MTEAEVIQQMIEHLEGLFPKTCGGCDRQFTSLREFFQITRHLGAPRPYDAEFGNWTPARPLGTVTYATCPCGHTLSLSSDGMPLPRLWRLLNWARTETQRRHMTPRMLLSYLRDEIDRRVLAPLPEGATPSSEPAIRAS